jgi:serine/threonine protein phosphatase PrpC
MSTCPSCKAENPDSYQFCQFCGTKITIDEAMNFSPDVAQALESNLEEIEIQAEDFGVSQVVSDQVVSDNEELYLDLKGLPEFSSEVSSILSLPICLQNIQDITYASKTDVGRQRDRNEDDFVAIFQTRSIDGKNQIRDRSYRGLFVLCDGMGGHEGGEEASAIAVNSISDQFRQFWIDTLPGEQKLDEIICNANQAIFIKNESEQRQSLGRMGTTLVMLAIHDLKVAIAHVGDSRIYKITNCSSLEIENNSEEPLLKSEPKLEPKLEQITRDHEVLNQLLDLGVDLEVAQASPDAHQLTQALGPNTSDHLKPSIQHFSLTEPTLFLLCSDGLCDNDVIEQNWRSHLLPILNKENDLQTGLDSLIELGNNVNGYDNLTAILILCDLAETAIA